MSCSRNLRRNLRIYLDMATMPAVGLRVGVDVTLCFWWGKRTVK